MSSEEVTTMVVSARPDRKVFRPLRKVAGIPAEILNDTELQQAIKVLPANYNFEIPKSIWRIKTCQAKTVALQFPEGLLIFALTIADILEKFTDVRTIIMGDVTYGACCIDDYTARALGADLMIHYGHSCLVPVNLTSNIKMLYVFVDIKIDTLHAMQTIVHNIKQDIRISLLSTIQFISTLQHISLELKNSGYDVQVPQIKPLSPGEVLGCTSPKLKNCDALIFIGDGRFHLESAMIANPSLPAYRYNPYDKTFTREYYEYSKLKEIRKNAINTAQNSGTFGLILGTLGRQGSPKVFEKLKAVFKRNEKNFITVLLSEIFPEKLSLFSGIDAWVQVACPRLSIDWGTAFEKPLLTPYEFAVVLKESDWQNQYPMDFYANQSLGPWTPNHVLPPVEKGIKDDDECQKCTDCSCKK